MYRGRPAPRGGFPPPFEARGPPPRPYPASCYRDERTRPRLPYYPSYHKHGHPDSYRRSPPRRRYPSPGTGGHRSSEFRAGGQAIEISPSPHSPIPADHNLVITVGNELTGPPGPGPPRHHDRAHPARPEYERGRSRGPSQERGRSRGPSQERGRAKSRGRSKSRPRSRSPDLKRAKSQGRSQSPSPNRSRTKSRGRSKSRLGSRSRSRSRSRGRSRGRSFSHTAGHARSKSRPRSRSPSQVRDRSASTSSSSSDDGENSRKEFKELDRARRQKELEEMLSLPTKSILKKRNNSEDSPSIRSSDSPRGLDSSSMSRMADQLLQAVKSMEPHMVASMLSELQSDPQMAENTEIKEILNLLSGAIPGGGGKVRGGVRSGGGAPERIEHDIDDEEKFLYGESEDPKPAVSSEPTQHCSLDLYSDVTEDMLYSVPLERPAVTQLYGAPSGPSAYLQVPSTVGEVDVRYVSQPSVSSNQSITIQVPNPVDPPGMEPLDEGERQALEEYEKIQDLLKTIGLDLGVAEISKMAARTKERLHGNKPPPKTPTRRRYSSGSSSGSYRSRSWRGQSGGSSSSSRRRRRRRRRGHSWSSDDNEDRKKISAQSKPPKDWEVEGPKAECSNSAPPPPQSSNPSPVPPHTGVPVPTYTPPTVHGMMPPNFPPPGYSQYGNYLPYVPQQWPPMYPPPSMNLPPPAKTNEYPPSLPYSKPVPEPSLKGSAKSMAHDGETGSSRDLRVSEEQNNESQRQKVLEEQEKLRVDRDVRMKKKEYLMKELERLRKQQGELLRKKRREKDGHKDPLLQEISRLQEEVMTQISTLRREHETAERERREIDKVALILGLSPSDRPRKLSKPTEVMEDEPQPPETKKRVAERGPEDQQAASRSCMKATSSAMPCDEELPATAMALPPEPFEYYDAGNHWCKNCNITSGSMFDFFTHLQSKSHRKTLDPYDRPWASTTTKTTKTASSEEKLTKPAKGSEFLLPIRGFFCLLCCQFYGDAICAEEHVTTHAHNEKYKKQVYENPLYEQRRNLDRQAGLSSETSGKKRKHDDEEKAGKDKEEKFRYKKEKKEKKDEGEKSKVKKEEEEKIQQSKKDDSRNVRRLQEEAPSYTKKDGDDKYKLSKKEDKYLYSREDEEQGDCYRHSREDEYRYRYRKDDSDKYKHGKHQDSRFKYNRDEAKFKTEVEEFQKSESDKPSAKQEASRPVPTPRIFCGPSPAMRAKLRKQSLEAGKPAPAIPSFGKFLWKKKENVLEKEAQKVAAEFIKDDEAAAKEPATSAEDSFAKSMAVAKEIAQKLAGQQTGRPQWISKAAQQDCVRSTNPQAVGLERNTTPFANPDSLSTFPSNKPQTRSLLGCPPNLPVISPAVTSNTLNFPAFGTPGQYPPMPPPPTPRTPKSIPHASKNKPNLPIKPDQMSCPNKPTSLVSVPGTFIKSAALASVNVPAQAALAPPAKEETTPAQTAMIKIVTDVAAPGVPVDEQTHTVYVKPPPFMNLSQGTLKFEKHKSSLAAGKAQDLLEVFYSSVSQSRPSITKPATEATTEKNCGEKRPVEQQPQPLSQTGPRPLPETLSQPEPQPQPLSQPRPQPQPLSQPEPRPQPQPLSQPEPQPQPEPLSQPEPRPQPEPLSQPEPQPLSQPERQPQPLSQPQPLLQREPQPQPELQVQPLSQPQPEPQLQLQPEQPPQTPLQPLIQTEVKVHKSPHQVLNGSPRSPQSLPKLDIQIASLWTLLPDRPEVSQITSQSNQCQSPSESQTDSEPKSAPELDHDSQPHRETTPEKEQRAGPKTRAKRIPPAPRPTRQTRSQTRYQTRRQQQHSQLEPEPEVSAHSDSVAMDSKEVDSSNPDPRSQLEVGAAGEQPGMMAITPETLGLPSDMTCLNFDFDFNFE